MIEGLPINGLDLTVGIVLLISALLAFIRGFVHEVLSVAAWLGALAAATYGLPHARPFAHRIIPFGWAADAAAATIIFLVVLIVLGMISHALAMRIQKSALNNLDRTLGFVFGLGRAVLILGVGLIVVDWLTDRERPAWVRTAKTLPIIETSATLIKGAVPASFMAPSEVALDAAKKAGAASDAKKAFDRLAAPTAEKAEKQAKETTYQNNERQDMERLLRSTGETPGEAGAPKAPESPPHE